MSYQRHCSRRPDVETAPLRKCVKSPAHDSAAPAPLEELDSGSLGSRSSSNSHGATRLMERNRDDAIFPSV